MARYKDREKALLLRRRGLSYSAIKEKLNVSKSTLSYWLRDLPLTREEINRLRATSPQRIERYRETMRIKRESRLEHVYEKVKHDIKKLNNRERFIAGLFLYWGEGGKTMPYTISLTNTDPTMIRFYVTWLHDLNVPKKKIRARLQLYTDMDTAKAQQYWSKLIGITVNQFRTPQIKKTDSKKIHYRGYGQGTCTIIVDERDVSEYILQGLQHIRTMYQK